MYGTRLSKHTNKVAMIVKVPSKTSAILYKLYYIRTVIHNWNCKSFWRCQ